MSLTKSKIETLLIYDENSSSLIKFVKHIADIVIKTPDYSVKILDGERAASLFKTRGFDITQRYIVTIFAENIGEHCDRFKRLTHHDIHTYSPDFIFWEEGDRITTAETPLPLEITHGEDLSMTSTQERPVFRKSKTTLPHWLDCALFKVLNAKYAPEYERYKYNLDLNEDEIKVYLGTYFPRSYSEIFCIYDNLLQHEEYLHEINTLSTINILDVGCGTGGELLGIITSLTKHISTPKHLNIIAYDGNEGALQALSRILSLVQSHTHHKIAFTLQKKVFNLRTRPDTKIFGNNRFQIILCDKMICELISRNIINNKAYYQVAKYLTPLLDNNGISILLDVTTKDEISGLFFPQLMNLDINQFVRENKEYSTLLPLCCAQTEHCNERCFMQQTFYVNHSLRANDESKVCYRILCKTPFKQRIKVKDLADYQFIIHSNKFKMGDNTAICKKSKGKTYIDSFNILQ